MKRMLAATTLALAALALTVGPGVGAAPGKTTICHFTGKKYIAVTVSNKALAQHEAHHADLINPATVPQNNRAAARAFCANLPVLTPTRGGTLIQVKLTSTVAGLSGDLSLRARFGQGDVCLTLHVKAQGAAALSLLSAALTQSTGLNVPLTVSNAKPNGKASLKVSACQSADRLTVKSILKSSAASWKVSISTSQGELTGKLGS